MNVVILLGILTTTLAYLAKYKQFGIGLKVSFFLIFLFLALRYNFGRDYPAYLTDFIKINSYSNIDFFDKSLYYEPGWIFLCWIFEPLGFFGLIFVLAFFNCLIYYRLIKKYVQVQYFWLAVFLYVFNTNFMLFQATAVRQSISIALFLLSLDYLCKKDAIRYFLFIALSSLFHTSAIILLPFYLIGLLNWRISKAGAIIVFLLYLFTLLFVKYLIPYIHNFTSYFFQRYAIFQNVYEMPSLGIGFLFFTGLFVLTLYYSMFQSNEKLIFFKIAIVSFLLIPFTLVMGVFDRINVYLLPATMVVYPIVLFSIKNALIKRTVAGALIVITMYMFFNYFEPGSWKESFKNYQTIFSSTRYY